MKHATLLSLAALLISPAAKTQAAPIPARYVGWQWAGSVFVITTPEGANLQPSAVLEGFPLLVRLRKDTFDFTKAQPHGEDLRFTTADGVPLAYEIEDWDVARGEAAVWVRVPKIVGNARQELRMLWGKRDAKSESNGKAVFNESNGYVSVLHLGESVADEVGTLVPKNLGTTPVRGIIGQARHFADKQGISGGDDITTYPGKGISNTTEAWVRTEQPSGMFVGWGKEGGDHGNKVLMMFSSPMHVQVESDFSGVNAPAKVPLNQWLHVVHTCGEGPRRVYVNGVLAGESSGGLNLKATTDFRLGGWSDKYNFQGDLDEVRVSRVARSADWVRLTYENQNPSQTLVGTLVQPGMALAVSSAAAIVLEGKSATFAAQAGGAQKILWVVKRDGKETVVATDRFSYTFEAGRVTGDKPATLIFKAVYPNEVRTKEIAITVKEDIAEPAFTLKAPAAWDGRAPIEVAMQITNLAAMQAKGAGELKVNWTVAGLAATQEIVPGKLLLKRAQNSGILKVTATVNNGGTTTQTVNIAVTEPKSEPWVAMVPGTDEKPMDGQFYARDDKGEGTLYYNGKLTEPGDSVFLKVYADDKLTKTATARLMTDKAYALSAKLKPGLIKYKVEFGVTSSGREKLLQTVTNIVCGDAYIIDGQSNALATDTHDQSPSETNEWIRSYGRPQENPKNAANQKENLWCLPVWRVQAGEKAELGWWGMELAKRLVASQKIPIFIVNGAVGGTRIEQHQRNATDPTDLTSIYGRMLWRVQQARLTHGIRGVLWHQGESNQGASGSSDFDWVTYEDYFVAMSGAWRQDFPNIQNLYTFQIWPDSCSMAGKSGAGDHIREVQRSLPRLYSHMSVMSTLGVKPSGGCHYPLIGWSEFARLIQPLVERDNYGKKPTDSITPPNLLKAKFSTAAKDSIVLEFDQPIVWTDALIGQFYLDGERDKVNSGILKGNVLTLALKAPSSAAKLTYLKETDWSQEKLIRGTNGIAALTFCEVPIAK